MMRSPASTSPVSLAGLFVLGLFLGGCSVASTSTPSSENANEDTTATVATPSAPAASVEASAAPSSTNVGSTTAPSTETSVEAAAATDEVVPPPADMLLSNDEASGDGWYVRLGPDMLASLGRKVGDQIRLETNGRAAVFTLSGVSSVAQIELNSAGLARLGLSTAVGAKVKVSTKVVQSDLSDAAAKKSGEFVERASDHGNNFVVAIAPHGGDIEAFTDAQAEQLASEFGTKGTSWVSKGWGSFEGAFSEWHVRSEDISVASYPELQKIASRTFQYSVAFHGWTNKNILVGGNAPLSLRKEIGKAIRDAIKGSGITVNVATSDRSYDGNLPENITNRLAKNGEGIQIEQSKDARDQYWQPIAHAVATVLAKHK